MIGITPSQQRVLDYVIQFQGLYGSAPTRAEIAAALGFASDNSAHKHLKALEMKGYVRLTSGVARGIRVMEQA